MWSMHRESKHPEGTTEAGGGGQSQALTSDVALGRQVTWFQGMWENKQLWGS